MSSPGHVHDIALAAWVQGRLQPLAASAVDRHVMGCPECCHRIGRALARTAVADPAVVPPPVGVRLPGGRPDLEQAWSGVRDTLELPRASRLERLLTAAGLPAADAVLAAGAPALRAAWGGVLALVLLFVAAAGLPDGHGYAGTAFLMVAPLVPVAGVALAYSAESDPALEQEVATPYPLLRLVVVRSAAVLAVSLPLVAAAGLLMPARISALWLLPALAFTAAVLAASTWTDAAGPALALSLGWLATVTVTALEGSPLVLLTTGGLSVYLVLLVGGALTFALRARRLCVLGRLP